MKADLNYKMLVIKDHYELTYKQYLEDPFKKHYIYFETTRDKLANQKIKKTQYKTRKMIKDLSNLWQRIN